MTRAVAKILGSRTGRRAHFKTSFPLCQLSNLPPILILCVFIPLFSARYDSALSDLAWLSSGLSWACTQLLPSSLADPSSVLCVALTLLSTQLHCPDSSACYTQAPVPHLHPTQFFQPGLPAPTQVQKQLELVNRLSANWGWKILYQSQWSRGMEQLREEGEGLDKAEGR